MSVKIDALELIYKVLTGAEISGIGDIQRPSRMDDAAMQAKTGEIVQALVKANLLRVDK